MVQAAGTERGAAEMVGVLMLIAIFVVVIAIIAVVLFSSPPPDKNPAVNLRISNESRLIKLYHAGGDSLQKDKLQIFVDGALRTFNGFGTDNTWSLGETLDYTAPVSDPMPSKIDVVYAESPRRGTNAALITTFLLGNQTGVTPDVTVFTITASAGSGGSISPSGTILIVSGSPAPFTITPDPFYTIADVIIDGVSVGPVPGYTFPPVTSSHTITVAFVPPSTSSFRINATAGDGGTIFPLGNVLVPFGENRTFNVTPDSGYMTGSVVVNGTPVIPVPSSYTFANVTTNHTIAATFSPNFVPGIIANYYLGQTWSVPAATNVAARIHFADAASGAASDVANWPVDYIGRDEDFSVNFSGYIRIDTESDYTFYLTSDDGSWLNIDGNPVINNGGLHSPAMVQQTVHLTPGYHPIVLPMYENSGGAVVWLEYSSPSVPRTFSVPLFHIPITSPTVDFTGTPLAGTAPHTVQFTDASIDATTWQWNFGDGSPVSYTQNPTHTFPANGLYTVTLIAANSFGANAKTRLNYISVGTSYSPGLIGTYFANETWTDPGRSRTDLRIRFADSASGEVSDETNWPNSILGQTDFFSVNWDGYLRVNTSDSYTFSLRSDDGSWLWIDESQIINNGGLHGATTVTGTVSLAPGYHHIVVRMYEHTGQAVARLQYASPNMTIKDVSDVWHVEVVYPPVTGFTGAPLIGNAPLTVVFTDTSTNTPTSWLWDFGDADSTNNTRQHPVHLYGAAGTYNVTLTSANTGGSTTVTKSNYVTASSAVSVVSFTGAPISGIVPLTVTFADSSTNTPTSWSWNFGDGDPTNSTVKNPVHRFSATGTYNISLTVTNAGGTNSSVRTNYITVYPQPTVAGFTATPKTGTNPLVVLFTDSSTNTPTSWSWNFGDGDPTNSTVKNPVHRYTNAGTYTVSLTATNAGGSNTSTRTGYIVVSHVLIPASRILLNTGKTSDLVSGGYIQFTVRGGNSNIIHGGVSHSLNNNDVVRLTINSGTRGQIYAAADQITAFSFYDVGLSINSFDYGKATINSIYIKNSQSSSSTLMLNMPSQSAWTQLVADTTTIISGPSSSPVGVYQLWNTPTGTTNLNNLGSTYYDGPVSGYSIT